MSVLRILPLLVSVLFLTACPERPDAERATQACENLLVIANQHSVDAKTADFQAATEDDQLQKALQTFTRTLGEDKRASGLAAFKKSFKPVAIDEQKKKATADCSAKLGSDLDEETRTSKLKACVDAFKPISIEAQEMAEIAKLEKAGSLPPVGAREAKIAAFKKSFKPATAEEQKKAAKEAVLNALAKELEERKVSDPKYKETLDTCIKGLQELGTNKQADCMVKATTQKQAEACRNER